MATVFDEMIYAQLWDWLENEIKYLESETTWYGSFFAPASRCLNASDFKKLVKSAKKISAKLEKSSAGCPQNPKEWRKHYSS